MIKKELRVLMVEDAAPDMVLINHELRKAGLSFRSRRVESREAFLHELENHPPDVILSDHGVPGFDGFAALAEARNRCPDVPFIFVTGGAGGADDTLKSGADDYVLKTRLHLLAPAIDRVVRDADTRARYRQVESALVHAEEHLRIISTELKDCAAFMLDATGCVATWNPGAEEMLGYEPNEILGESYSRIFPREAIDRDWPGQLLAKASKEGRAEESEWRERKDGRPFRAHTAVIPLSGQPKKLRGFLCVLRDLTKREPDESIASAREQALKAETAQRELEEFTHTVALDLRTPLRHIESFSELLLKSLGERVDPKNLGHIKTISESARVISRLVDDLFTFSRISRAEMYHLHLSLGDIVKEVVNDLRHETEGRHIEWHIDALPEVVGDPVMIWQALTNLIGNALKFSRRRRVARIEVGISGNDLEHIIFVRDNGVGFDPDQAQKLFNVFQRLHAQDFDGTGVGLANVRRIIHRHGGRVWAEGKPDEGATFYFSLPRETSD